MDSACSGPRLAKADEQVLAAGQPSTPRPYRLDVRGRSCGRQIGGAAVSVGEAVGESPALPGGMRANEASSGMPQWMLDRM